MLFKFSYNIRILQIRIYMKKNTIVIFSLFLAVHTSAQLAVQSVHKNDFGLIINDSINLKKGDLLQIHLPAGNDFMFVKKKSILSTKLIGNLSDIAGTGVAAIGMGSNNLKVLHDTNNIINAANAIHKGSDAISKIEDLPISKQAKRIAGKKMKIVGWEFTDNGYVILAEYETKNYEIYLQEAAISGEIKF